MSPKSSHAIRLTSCLKYYIHKGNIKAKFNLNLTILQMSSGSDTSRFFEKLSSPEQVRCRRLLTVAAIAALWLAVSSPAGCERDDDVGDQTVRTHDAVKMIESGSK